MNEQRLKYIENCKQNFREFASNNQYLIRYVRDGKNNKIGVVIARLNEDGIIEYAWSKANVAKKEKFDRYIGINTAIKRILRQADIPIVMPRKVTETVKRLAPVALRYFHLNKEEQVNRLGNYLDSAGMPSTLVDKVVERATKIYG